MVKNILDRWLSSKSRERVANGLQSSYQQSEFERLSQLVG